MYREDVYEHVQEYLQLVLQPSIIAVGFFGNFAAITIILSSAYLRKLASNNYLVALAACDLAFLVTLLFVWLEALGAPDIHQTNELGCKTLTYVAHVSDIASVWLIVAVTVDRFIILYWPRLKPILGAIRFHLRLTAAIIGGSAAFSVWTFASAEITLVEQCDFAWNARWYIALNTLDAVFTGFLPTIIISCLNVAIVLRLKRLAILSRDRNRVGAVLKCLKLAELPVRQLSNICVSCDDQCVTTSSFCAESPPHTEVEMIEKQITPALLAVTTIYVSLNLPCYAVRLIGSLFRVDERSTAFFALKCVELASYYLYYLHHAINFYLYTLFSPQMREALKRFVQSCFHFCCGCDLRRDDDDFHLDETYGSSSRRTTSAVTAV